MEETGTEPSGSTARRGRAEDSHGLLELHVSSMTDYAIFATDFDGRISTWNTGACQMYGYEADEVIGEHVAVLHPQESIERGNPDQELAIAVADGHYEEEEWRLRKDGYRFWASVAITPLRGEDGRLVGFGTVTRDLTERRRGEEALRESEERFRLLVSGVSDYAIFLLDSEGRVASWNLGAERLKGYRADEILGHHFSTFYTEDDLRAGVPDAALEEARGTGRWEAEGWRVRQDGGRFWANVVITSLIGADGRHRGFAKVTRDLTDRKRSEDALRGVLERERETAAQLRDVDRIRTELVSTVAHDLRAPVSVVRSLLHLLRTGWDESSDDERLDLIDRAAERAQTLAELADDVFDLVRIDVDQLRVAAVPIDVGAIVEEVARDARTTDQSHAIETRIDADSWAIGDERRTWQVVTNLVSNAMKYPPAGSTVEISVGRRDDEVLVSVVDDGPGIPRDQHQTVFERFGRVTSRAAVSGSGLGLFIAKALVEAQGGRITLESEPGAGAAFRFTLPARNGRSS